MNIVFFGSSSCVIPIIKTLNENFNLSLVLTTETPKPNLASKGEALRSYPVVNYCLKNKIPYLSVSSPSDLIHNSSFMIHNSFLGVLAYFGLIIPEQILNLFPKGIINIHPSLLPKYRGPTPVQTAILNGEKFTGVSIMRLDEEIDHGSILGQKKEEILSNDTAESLYKRLFEKGANLLSNILNKYLEGNIKPIPQNHKEATFTKPLTRQDGFIDLRKAKSEKRKAEISRMIRAYFPWPGVWTKLNLKTKDQKLRTIKFLPGNLIQAEGKKPMSYKDFLNGYPDARSIMTPILK